MMIPMEVPTKLRPCPFCFERGNLVVPSWDWGARVECGRCRAAGPSIRSVDVPIEDGIDVYEAARRAWNVRPVAT